MRTTLTLDDDVAAAVERLRRARAANFKDIVNEALRRGLKEMAERRQPSEPYRTQTVDLGRAHMSLDNIGDAVAIAEGDHAK